MTNQLATNVDAWLEAQEIPSAWKPISNPTAETVGELQYRAVRLMGFEPDALTWVTDGKSKRADFGFCHVWFWMFDSFSACASVMWTDRTKDFNQGEADCSNTNELHKALIEARKAARPKVVRVEVWQVSGFEADVLPLVNDGYIIQHAFSHRHDVNDGETQVYILALPEALPPR